MASASSVLSKEDADKLAVAYSPRKFPSVISASASDFMAFQDAGGDRTSFMVDPLVAEQTGMARLERANREEKAELEALERLKDLQEQAYNEAYELGLEEGRQKAFAEKREEFAHNLVHFEQLIKSIESLKSDLVASNETQILRLVTYLVRRLAMAEIETNQSLVLQVIQTALSSAQTDEAITVRLSPSDMNFVEQTRMTLGKEFEALKQAKIEASEDVANGGCIIETNYGDVDATMEQRFNKLWLSLSEKLPAVKSTVSSSGSSGDTSEE